MLKFLTISYSCKQFLYFCLMQFFKNVFDFFLNASIHVALAVYALVQITALNFHFEYNADLSFVTFFGTIVTYNFIKYGSRAKKYFIVEKEHHKAIQLFSFLAGICMLFFVFRLPLSVIIGLGVLTFISVLYIIPFYTQKKGFRNFIGIKIYIVALVWSGTTVLLPVLNENSAVTNDVVVEMIQRFLFVLVVILPFEIRDMAIDQESLHTIPQQIGVKNTKILGVFLIVIFLALEFFKDEFFLSNVFSLLIVKAAVIFLLVFSKRKQSKYYSSFYVEGIPLIWWGIKVILASNYQN